MTVVHLSASTFTCQSPAQTMGSTARVIPGSSRGTMAGRPEVTYLGGLVELGAHTVAHKVPNHGEAEALHIGLNRMTDVGNSHALPGHLDALPETLLSHLDELHSLGAHLPTGVGGGAVSVEAVYIAPTSTLTMSPSFSFRGPGIPWITTSLTEMQAEPGNPP